MVKWIKSHIEHRTHVTISFALLVLMALTTMHFVVAGEEAGFFPTYVIQLIVSLIIGSEMEKWGRDK